MALDPNLQERLEQLVRQLMKQTSAGRISWSSTDSENIFMFSGEKSSVLIEQHLDRDGDPWTTLKILNERGTQVEELLSEYESDPGSGGYRLTSPSQNLRDLYSLARSSALEIDEVLDSLFSDLE